MSYTTKFFKFWLLDKCLDNRWFLIICNEHVCAKGPHKILEPRASQSLNPALTAAAHVERYLTH